MTNWQRVVVACAAPLLRFLQDAVVIVQATLVGPDGPVRALADPGGGGLFDAAGDFDRLLTASGPAGGCLSRVDPYGSTSFEPAEMDALVDEVDRLECRSRPGSLLNFLGD